MSSQPRPSISSLTLSPLWALRGCPSPPPGLRAGSALVPALQVGLEEPGGGSAFHGQRWPHPGAGHARKQRGVLALRLRGTLSRRPSCVPSWTNPTGEKAKCSCPSRLKKTGQRASRAPDTITFQAALRHWSRSSAPTVLFFERSPSASKASSRWVR